MQQSLKYRRIVSVAFLLLYLFIATPVQIWHHHTAIREKAAIFKSADEKAAAQSEDCSVCKHTYAAYFNDEVGCVLSSELLFSSYNACYNFSILSPSKGDTSNKSPPVV